MKCHICDKEINGDEIQYNRAYQEWEPCGTCLEIAMEAAYSDGHDQEDDVNLIVLDVDYDDVIPFSDVPKASPIDDYDYS